MEIDWNAIDKKWQKQWLENNDHEADSNNKEKKFITVAYPYPNSPQHIGHGRTYTIADVHSRYLRMKGFNVLFPMGFHYTGTPILGMAKRVEANDTELIEGFKTLYKVPEDKIKEFVEPIKIADYYHEEIKSGMVEMGYSIENFDGKRIASPQISNSQDVSLRHYLASNGLKPIEKGGTVFVLNISNPDIYTLFAKGEIDGAWIPEPWATMLVQDLDGVRLFNEEKLWPNEQFASVLLIARTD